MPMIPRVKHRKFSLLHLIEPTRPDLWDFHSTCSHSSSLVISISIGSGFIRLLSVDACLAGGWVVDAGI